MTGAASVSCGAPGAFVAFGATAISVEAGAGEGACGSPRKILLKVSLRGIVQLRVYPRAAPEPQWEVEPEFEFVWTTLALFAL